MHFAVFIPRLTYVRGITGRFKFKGSLFMSKISTLHARFARSLLKVRLSLSPIKLEKNEWNKIVLFDPLCYTVKKKKKYRGIKHHRITQGSNKTILLLMKSEPLNLLKATWDSMHVSESRNKNGKMHCVYLNISINQLRLTLSTMQAKMCCRKHTSSTVRAKHDS